MNEEMSKNALKSSTSLVGIVCKDGVVVGADRRSTADGRLVLNKTKTKIRHVTPNIIAAYTGVVADIELLHKVLSAELKLRELSTHTKPTVGEAANLMAMLTYRGVRAMSPIPSIVGSLIAGVNPDGSTELYTIEPFGAVLKVEDYDANFSSGMPFILGILEKDYNKNMNVQQGAELARACLRAAMERDTGSGNGIDVFAITKDGIKHVISEQLTAQVK
ncbi:hypothetical protein D6817_01380 [Candidatus Pacearchaeota archaeon]|nr:MAG: hypothetical protein D6817_01380 [Candidatus Pacearchaeota archaeon]